MITGFIFAVLFIVLAIVFLTGKGDKLIAGQRLRLLMAFMILFTAGFCFLMGYVGKDSNVVLNATGLFIVITFVFIILANTWAIKK